MKVIGLTGGIATGKSLAAEHLKQRFGVPCIDTDAIAHQLLKRGEAGYKPVVALFGPQVVEAGGQISRSKLAELVFSDPTLRTKLNQILHPLILSKSEKALNYLRDQGRKVALLSAALILEENLAKRFDDLIIIIADPKTQLNRLVNDRHEKKAMATKRLESQWSNEERLKQGDYFVVTNDGSRDQFKAALEHCWQQLMIKHKLQ